eukprot:GSA120T00019768001.1
MRNSLFDLGMIQETNERTWWDASLPGDEDDQYYGVSKNGSRSSPSKQRGGGSGLLRGPPRAGVSNISVIRSPTRPGRRTSDHAPAASSPGTRTPPRPPPQLSPEEQAVLAMQEQVTKLTTQLTDKGGQPAVMESFGTNRSKTFHDLLLDPDVDVDEEDRISNYTQLTSQRYLLKHGHLVKERKKRTGGRLKRRKQKYAFGKLATV